MMKKLVFLLLFFCVSLSSLKAQSTQSLVKRFIDTYKEQADELKLYTHAEVVDLPNNTYQLESFREVVKIADCNFHYYEEWLGINGIYSESGEPFAYMIRYSQIRYMKIYGDRGLQIYLSY